MFPECVFFIAWYFFWHSFLPYYNTTLSSLFVNEGIIEMWAEPFVVWPAA